MSRCSPVAAGAGAPVAPLYDWRPTSTYIRRPPYWDTEGLGGPGWPARATLKGMRPLAILPDNITTDHLSPSNAILATSAAGEYLTAMGVPEEDYNSYATHRGDHLTAMRATFANPQLVNEMAVVDGVVKKGSLARVEPDGKVMRMWEAIETYLTRRQPLIIIAGGRLRPGIVARLGRQGRAPCGCRSHCRRRFRTHPPHQSDRHGRAARWSSSMA